MIPELTLVVQQAYESASPAKPTSQDIEEVKNAVTMKLQNFFILDAGEIKISPGGHANKRLNFEVSGLLESRPETLATCLGNGLLFNALRGLPLNYTVKEIKYNFF